MSEPPPLLPSSTTASAPRRRISRTAVSTSVTHALVQAVGVVVEVARGEAEHGVARGGEQRTRVVHREVAARVREHDRRLPAASRPAASRGCRARARGRASRGAPARAATATLRVVLGQRPVAETEGALRAERIGHRGLLLARRKILRLRPATIPSRREQALVRAGRPWRPLVALLARARRPLPSRHRAGRALRPQRRSPAPPRRVGAHGGLRPADLRAGRLRRAAACGPPRRRRS